MFKIFLAFSYKIAYRGKTANFRKKYQDIFFVKNLILYKKGIFIFFPKIIRNWDILKKLFLTTIYPNIHILHKLGIYFFVIWETTLKGFLYTMHTFCKLKFIIIKASNNLITLKLVKIKKLPFYSLTRRY